MADVGNAFESAEYLAAWASKEVAQFAAMREAFFTEPNTSARVVEFDPDSGQYVGKIRLLKPLPMEMRGLASNVIKNFRDALDQTTFAATLLIREKRSNRAHFPFGESPDDLENSLSRRRSVPCQGLPEELFPVLRQCEPYPRGDGYSGGKDAVRALGRVSGDNKHAVTLTVSGTTVGASLLPPAIKVGPGGAALFVPTEWDPLKNEMKLFTFPPGGYVEANIEVAFSVVFGPGPLERVTVEDYFSVLTRDVPIIIERVKKATAEIISDR